jgi:hypothetical protein
MASSRAKSSGCNTFPSSIMTRWHVVAREKLFLGANSLGQAVPADAEDLITIISTAESHEGRKTTDGEVEKKSINP